MSSTATALVPSGYQGPQGSQIARVPVTSSIQVTPQRPTQNGPPKAKEEVVSSPGRFQHPRMAEIVKRRAATSFTEKNVQTVVLNVVALIGTFMTSRYILNILAAVTSKASLEHVLINAPLILNGIRLILLSNIFLAIRPVLPYVKKPDAIEDIPLTPSQRALLGLTPSKTNTPQSPADSAGYVTPPRYRRSSPSPFAGTPQSNATGRRSISANYSSSPLSTSRYAVDFLPTPQGSDSSRRVSGSPFSPSSPLLHKALVASTSQNNLSSQVDLSESTTSFLGTSWNSYQGGHLRRSQSMRERVKQSHPGTPSPNARDRMKVNMQAGLNYKWVYEKGLRVKEDGGIEY